MKPDDLSVKLMRQEFEYLVDAGFLSQSQRDAVRNVEWLSGSCAILRLSRTSAETFRDAFTEQLAKVGFDEEYHLTHEGKTLEELMDRFHHV